MGRPVHELRKLHHYLTVTLHRAIRSGSQFGTRGTSATAPSYGGSSTGAGAGTSGSGGGDGRGGGGGSGGGGGGSGGGGGGAAGYGPVRGAVGQAWVDSVSAESNRVTKLMDMLRLVNEAILQRRPSAPAAVLQGGGAVGDATGAATMLPPASAPSGQVSGGGVTAVTFGPGAAGNGRGQQHQQQQQYDIHTQAAPTSPYPYTSVGDVWKRAPGDGVPYYFQPFQQQQQMMMMQQQQQQQQQQAMAMQRGQIAQQESQWNPLEGAPFGAHNIYNAADFYAATGRRMEEAAVGGQVGVAGAAAGERAEVREGGEGAEPMAPAVGGGSGSGGGPDSPRQDGPGPVITAALLGVGAGGGE